MGLDLLHCGKEPMVDFIFVHGLGGGSRKTWSKTSDESDFWPKERLPRDPTFSNATRIHSFGYQSNWVEKESALWNIQDFALSLLEELRCNEDIRQSNVSSNIALIFVGSS